MYTDFYFTNTSAKQKNEHLVFFQDASSKALINNNLFASIEHCPPKWMCKIRLVWNLSFRFKKKTGSLSPKYDLKTVYHKQRPYFFISKEGSIKMEQDCNSGCQFIHFNQLKGNEFIGVQLYRGFFLIEEKMFNQNQLSFITDLKTQITSMEVAKKNLLSDKAPASIAIDFTGLKSVHIISSKDEKSILSIDTLKTWH